MNSITTKHKILKTPMVRIILGLIICFGVFIIGQQLFVKIPGVSTLSSETRNLIKGIFVSILIIGSYLLFYSKYEKRKVTEFATTQIWKRLLAGLIIGTFLQLLTIYIIYLFGDFKIISINKISTIIIPFTVAFTVAIFEEILMRGIIFRITEEKLGSIIALVISGAIFGGLHIFSPHYTFLSVLSICIAGILFGASYIYHRNLWLPIAIHFAWNFTQNGIFGATTSGIEETSSLLTTSIKGKEIITGGLFGPEGSIQALLFLIIATAIIIRLLYKQNKMLKPSWKR